MTKHRVINLRESAVDKFVIAGHWEPGICMPAYRLYRLDGSGKIDSAEWIEAEAEEAAIGEARARFPDGGFEVWHRERLVRRESRSDA